MSPSAELELPELERKWMDAWVRKDLDACSAILGDDFILTSARGSIMSKADWLAGLEVFDCTSFAWDEIKVRPFGEVAIVHCRTHQTASVAGHDWSGAFLLTDVWVRRDDRWQVVSRHGSGPLPAHQDPA
jgi:ketosteroid isomerase-like protein